MTLKDYEFTRTQVINESRRVIKEADFTANLLGIFLRITMGTAPHFIALMIASAISHVSLGTNHFEAALAFYDKVLATLDVTRILTTPHGVAYGKQFPEFWITQPHDGQPASVGNGTHVSFLAITKEAVSEFHKTALSAGAKDDGAPGPREEYGPQYYGAFVRDLDGHKIEAMFWDSE